MTNGSKVGYFKENAGSDDGYDDDGLSSLLPAPLIKKKVLRWSHNGAAVDNLRRKQQNISFGR